jgi:hypothetical protein
MASAATPTWTQRQAGSRRVAGIAIDSRSWVDNISTPALFSKCYQPDLGSQEAVTATTSPLSSRHGVRPLGHYNEHARGQTIDSVSGTTQRMKGSVEMGMKWLAGVVGVVVVIIVLVVWRPWVRSQDASLEVNFDPAELVTIVCVNKSGTPCKLTLVGSREGTDFDLSAMMQREGRATLKTPGPSTLEAATVERGNRPHRQELNISLDAGKTYEARVNGNDKVEVIPKAK